MSLKEQARSVKWFFVCKHYDMMLKIESKELTVEEYRESQEVKEIKAVIDGINKYILTDEQDRSVI